MINSTIKNLKNYTNKRGFLYYFLIVLGGLQSVLTVFFAISIKILINAVEFNEGRDKLILGAILVGIAVLLEFVCGVLFKVISARLVTENETAIKKKVFSSFILGSYKKISQTPSGELILKVDKDANAVSSIYTMFIPSLVRTIVNIVAVVVALLILEPYFTLLVLGCAIIVLIFTFIVRDKISYKYKDAREEEGKYNIFLDETATNSLAIKAFSAEENLLKRSTSNLKGLEKSKLSYRYFGSLTTSISTFAFALFYALTIVWGATLIVNETLNFGFGTLIAMLSLITQIKTPIATLSGYLSSYAELIVSSERLFSLVDETAVKQSLNGEKFEKIEIENACFSYGEKQVLNSVNLVVNKGDKVLIKGQSGIGKSTLLKIIAGLYPLNSGSAQIVVDGISYNSDSVSGLFAIVPQGNMLFTGTIRENLTFINENASEEEILKVIKIARLDEFINSLEKGLDTNIGVFAKEISEGQAQRLAVARAILSNRPIVLLDEVTSALDENTESELISSLSQIDGITIIAVSHKSKTQEMCNKTLEL